MAMEYADAIIGKEGKIFMTISGKTREIGELVSLEAKVELTTTDIKVVGRRMVGKKVTGANGSGSIKFHFIQGALREITANYLKTGVYPIIDIQAINDDPSVKGSRIVHNLKGCIFSNNLLNKIDADTDDAVLEESDFTFNDYIKM